MSYHPEVGASLSVGGAIYTFAEHPSAPGMPYGQSGRRATVYRVEDGDGEAHALKVFRPTFRTPRVADGALRLRPYAALPGLQVCDRMVMTPEQHPGLLAHYPDLSYAALMPWVAGSTWQEVLLEGRPLSEDRSRALALEFARVLARMEAVGVAHCDLSGPNVLVELDPPRVSLVDVEDLHAPGLVRPERLPGGSTGYAHRTAPHGLWGPTADRFAGAVLLAEMLGWCDERVRQSRWGETYFDPARMQGDSEGYDLLAQLLAERWGAHIAQAFASAWRSETLDACPPLSDWLRLLEAPATDEREAEGEKTEPVVALPRAAAADRLAWRMFGKAEALLELGQVDEAVAELAEAYRLAPAIAAEAYVHALKRRGKERERAGDLMRAIEGYQAAYDVAPDGGLKQELAATLADVRTRIGKRSPPRAAVCPGCERGVDPEWVHCPRCGNDLQSEGAVDGGSVRAGQRPPWWVWAVVLGVMVLLVVGAVAALATAGRTDNGSISNAATVPAGSGSDGDAGAVATDPTARPTPRPTARVAEGYVRYASKQSAFSIQYPKGWKLQEESESFEWKGREVKGPAVHFLPPSGPGEPFIGVLHFRLGEGVTSAQLVNTLTDLFTEENDVTVKRRVPQPDGTIRMEILDESDSGGGEEAVVLVRQVGTNVYFLIYGAESAHMGRYRPIFDTMVESYELPSSPAAVPTVGPTEPVAPAAVLLLGETPAAPIPMAIPFVPDKGQLREAAGVGESWSHCI